MAKGWREIWFEFSQVTTLHGVHFAADKQAHTFRRLFWVLVVIGGFTLFTLVLIANITHYISSPTNVNIKINHNTSLPFPAITICNQNAFRTTKAAAFGWYDDISKLYSINESQSLSKEFQEQSMLDLFTKTAHTKEDLVVRCNWLGQECDWNDFETVVTDHGVCSTFNGKNNDAALETSETGAEYGLELLMNVEQYEYMPGPHDAAGLKILVHDQDEIPLVKSMGLALPPGAHAFAGIKMLQIRNLPPEHGQCDDSTKLKYFDKYTVSACKVDELQRHITESCQCREMYMSEYQDHLQVCNVETQRTCVKYTLEHHRQELVRNSSNENADKKCPVPCFQTMFLSEISQSSISNFNTPNILASSNLTDLQPKFLNARETLQRVDKNIIQQDTSMIRDLSTRTLELKHTFTKLDGIAKMLSGTINKILTDMEPRVLFHIKALNASHYNVKNNMVRAWNIINERSGDYVADRYLILSSAFDEMLDVLINSNDENERKYAYMIVNKELSGKEKITETFLEKMSKVQTSFETRTSLLSTPYKTSLDFRYDKGMFSEYIIQWDLDYATMHFKNVETRASQIKDSTVVMKKLAKDVFERKLNDTDQWKNIDKDFQSACRRFYYWHYITSERIFKATLEKVAAKLERFENMNKTMYGKVDNILQDVAYVLEKIAKVNNSEWKSLEALSVDGIFYLTNKTKKGDLAINFTSSEVSDSVVSVKSLITDIRGKAGDISVDLNKFLSAYTALWTELVLGSQDVLPEAYQQIQSDVYALVNNGTDADEYDVIVATAADFMGMTPDTFLSLVNSTDVIREMNADLISMNLSSKIEEINEEFTSLKKQSNLAGAFDGSNEKYFNALEKLQSSLLHYLHGNEINGEFVRENFVRLDIYMQDLSYEYIEQQEAYDMIALFNDIGGSMGLLIGASLITLFEFLDAIGTTIGYFLRRRRHQAKDISSTNDDSKDHNLNKKGLEGFDNLTKV